VHRPASAAATKLLLRIIRAGGVHARCLQERGAVAGLWLNTMDEASGEEARLTPPGLLSLLARWLLTYTFVIGHCNLPPHGRASSQCKHAVSQVQGACISGLQSACLFRLCQAGPLRRLRRAAALTRQLHSLRLLLCPRAARLLSLRGLQQGQ